jgi:hypothetical protein
VNQRYPVAPPSLLCTTYQLKGYRYLHRLEQLHSPQSCLACLNWTSMVQQVTPPVYAFFALSSHRGLLNQKLRLPNQRERTHNRTFSEILNTRISTHNEVSFFFFYTILTTQEYVLWIEILLEWTCTSVMKQFLTIHSVSVLPYLVECASKITNAEITFWP